MFPRGGGEGQRGQCRLYLLASGIIFQDCVVNLIFILILKDCSNNFKIMKKIRLPNNKIIKEKHEIKYK